MRIELATIQDVPKLQELQHKGRTKKDVSLAPSEAM